MAVKLAGEVMTESSAHRVASMVFTALYVLACAAIVALVLPRDAFAWCSLPPPANPSSAPPVARTFAPLSCLPNIGGFGGSGRGFLSRDFAAVPGATTHGGSAWGWWCQGADGAWRPQTVAALDKYTLGGAAKAVAAAAAASAPLAALQATLDAYRVPPNGWVETHDWNCLHSNMVAALQATKPATTAPVWRTPGGGSSIFPVANGRLGAPIAGRRAPGAALCDLARLRIVVGSYTYGSLAGGPATEAVLCVQVAA